ncbi:MAG: glycosyltransferase [Leptolyngbyaceae cyanobacterium SM1_3_5]|nr:glycosyltransferase [Leptolyngbyaceae cyanobacterium SM1_3_5]
MNRSTTLPVQVLMMPDYRVENPYQTLLADALQQQVSVYFPTGYRRIFPIFRAIKDCAFPIQALHLHWINPYNKGGNWLKRSIYSLKFLTDILITRLSGVKVVWTIHNRLSHEAQFSGLELWTIRQLVKLVDRIIVHHQAARSELAKLYQFNPDKATVVPHGHYRTIYEEAIDRAEAKAILGLPPTGKIYLNLGMLRPYKGIERLLEVWRDHPEITANHTLLIAGKPLDDAYEQQLVKQVAATKGAVLHPGFVKDNSIPVYFSAADVVILPFENILTSGSLVLAMSYSKPIIAPRLGSIPETIGTADWLLYEADEEQGLLRAIEKSTEVNLNELERLTGEMGDRLSWDSIAHKTAQLY